MVPQPLITNIQIKFLTKTHVMAEVVTNILLDGSSSNDKLGQCALSCFYRFALKQDSDKLDQNIKQSEAVLQEPWQSAASLNVRYSAK